MPTARNTDDPDDPVDIAALVAIVLPVFGFIGLGYITVATGLLGDDVAEALGSFVFSLAMPILLFRGIGTLALPEINPFPYYGAYFCGAFINIAIGAVLIRRIFGRDARVAVTAGMSAAYSNIVMLGIPVVSEVFGEEALGELLASVDVMDHASLKSLRNAFTRIIDVYLKRHPGSRFRFVSEGEEFFFIKSVHLIMPSAHTASTLTEFAKTLEHISTRSLYFHIFDARLRLGRPTNDFALWFTEQLGLTALGESISRLDPYAHTLETLRTILVSLIRKELEGRGR